MNKDARIPKIFPDDIVLTKIYLIRDNKVMIDVRNQFLENKTKMLSIIESYKDHFDNPKEYVLCTAYIKDFFIILSNDLKFENKILNRARVK